MYKNYTYLSGTSNTMKQYFENFVNSINKNNKKLVLDIACNDGALLDVFKQNNFETYGIDPAENIVSKINNHNIYCGFFNNDAVKYYANKKFDIVTAFNVFAHVDDIYDFLNNLSKITDINSDIYIQTSQCNMIQNNEFDTVYHEHLSFFNVYSMSLALDKVNFSLVDIKIVDVHGSSYLFHIKKLKPSIKMNNSIMTRHRYEIKSKIFEKITYKNYSDNIYLWKDNLINLLKSSKNIIGVGASAKGITILNFIKEDLIKNDIKIECILDENPFKINKIINSVNIEIFSMKDIYLIKTNITFILFAWNFKDELIQKIKTLRSGNDKFINLFPLQIIN
jgi:SAM-dependent methyltransferase